LGAAVLKEVYVTVDLLRESAEHDFLFAVPGHNLVFQKLLEPVYWKLLAV